MQRVSSTYQHYRYVPDANDDINELNINLSTATGTHIREGEAECATNKWVAKTYVKILFHQVRF